MHLLVSVMLATIMAITPSAIASSTRPACCIGPNGACAPPVPIFLNWCPVDWTPIYDPGQCPSPCTISGNITHPVWGAGELVTDEPQEHPRELVWLRGKDYILALDKSKGGAIVSLFYGGLEMITDWGAGDQWQTAIHYFDGQKWSNPTQAGTSKDERWIPSQIHSFWSNGKSAEVIVIPMEWEIDSWGKVKWRDMRMGHRVDLDYAGIPGLIRHESIIYLPNPMPGHEHAQWWAIAHTHHLLNRFFRYDPAQRFTLVCQRLEITPPFPFPHSTVIAPWQSSVVSDGFSHALALIATDPLWDRTQMSDHFRDFRGSGPTTRLGVALANRPLPAGWTRLVSYWYVGMHCFVKPALDQVWNHLKYRAALTPACIVRPPRTTIIR